MLANLESPIEFFDEFKKCVMLHFRDVHWKCTSVHFSANLSTVKKTSSGEMINVLCRYSVITGSTFQVGHDGNSFLISLELSIFKDKNRKYST